MNGPYIILILVGACIIIYRVFFTESAIIKRKLRSIKLKDLNTVLDGETVKIRGEIVFLGNILKAPLSGRTCSYYHIVVEQKIRSGKHTRTETIIDEHKAANVILKSEGHYVIISTGIIKSFVMKDANYYSGFLNDASPVLENYLRKHKNKSEDWLGLNKNLTYKEGILEKGEIIEASGKATWRKASEVKPSLPCQRVLFITGDNEEPVYMTDDVDQT